VATVRSGSGSRLGERWAVLPLIAILCLGLFSIAASAGWAECIRAWLDGENAVRLLVTADEKGTVKFTIGRNVIRFAVTANVPLDTGRLRLDKAASVVVELFNADGVVTVKCEFPVAQLTKQPADFCCDREGPDVRVAIEPEHGQSGWINTEVTLRITAEDESGVAEIAYQSPVISDGDVVRVGPDRLELSDGGCRAETRRELYPQYTPGGRHEVECWAIDTAGNVSERVGVELQLDFDAPRIEMSVFPSGDAALVSWAVSDGLSGVRECRVTLIVGGAEHVFSTSFSGERTLTTSEFGAGSHEIRVWAIDQAGNEFSDSQPVTLVAQTCSISGQVVDSVTQQPVVGAIVTLDAEETRVTDAQGRFSFTNLEPRKHYLSFEKDGVYEFRSEGVTCRGGETRSITVSLVPVPVPPVSLSWSEDFDSTDFVKTASRGETVYLHLRAEAGSQWYLGCDLGQNSGEPRAWFMGVQLELSQYMQTVASGDSTGKCLWIEIPVSTFSDSVVYFQAFVITDGVLEISEVLTLRIRD